MERRRAALNKLEKDSTILFLCHGNICRSPFAERYARRQLQTREIDDITVESSGSLAQPDQRSPPNACTAANQHGVDLTDNYSTQANIKSIESADLILLMDYRNYHDFTTTFTKSTDKMFLLGIFDDHETIPISDPYGDTLETFRISYERIASSIDGILDAFETQQKNSHPP
jgi:protein-tyrosine phosphatase